MTTEVTPKVRPQIAPQADEAQERSPAKQTNERSVGGKILSLLVNPRCRAPKPERLAAKVAGKHVLITGASFGIGEATAYQLAAAGAIVMLVARSEDKLFEMVDDIRSMGGRAHAFPADLNDFEAVELVAGEIVRTFGHVDILINNAGKSIRRSIELSYERFFDFERTMSVNYLGPVRLILSLLHP